MSSSYGQIKSYLVTKPGANIGNFFPQRIYEGHFFDIKGYFTAVAGRWMV